jgi:hypothetical protein
MTITTQIASHLLRARVGKICVAITGNSPEEMLEKATEVFKETSFLEFRLDYLPRPAAALPDLQAFLAQNTAVTAIASSPPSLDRATSAELSTQAHAATSSRSAPPPSLPKPSAKSTPASAPSTPPSPPKPGPPTPTLSPTASARSSSAPAKAAPPPKSPPTSASPKAPSATTSLKPSPN